MAEKKSGVTTGLVRELAELLVEKELTEIDVKDKDVRIRLSRGGPSMTVPAPAVSVPSPGVQMDTTPASVAPPAQDKGNNKNAVPSPMVGTVYLAPAPEASPYVSEGSTVAKGDTILIIEAMKTMNHIVAPRSGTITSILVDDKQPVEFGEALVIIE